MISFARSRSQLQKWCEDNLSILLPSKNYKGLFDAVRDPKRSKRLTVTEMGVLWILLTEKRPDRSARDNMKYGNTNAITKVELADMINCSASAVQRSCATINKRVIQGAAVGSFAQTSGLILFHELGSFIQPIFDDATKAKLYSSKQLPSVTRRHNFNISLAIEHENKNAPPLSDDARIAAFKSLTPQLQAELLAAAARQ